MVVSIPREGKRKPPSPAPPVLPARHVAYAGQGPPEVTPWGSHAVGEFLELCDYNLVGAWSAPPDESGAGRRAALDLYGDPHGYFCLTIDYGNPEVAPSVIEASGPLNLARALRDLAPVLALLGLPHAALVPAAS
jgi:hypothetical protein